MYKYLIIEDNPAAIETLQLLLEEYDDFQSTIVSHDLKEGVKAVLTYKPDLVFLDVELPGFTGFDFIKLLRTYLKELPSIIMMTAHEKYALPAVNEEVLYYLLKPLDIDELFVALTKFRIKKAETQKSIAIKTTKGYSFFAFEQLLFVKSASNYTCFYTTSMQREIASKTMKEFEPYLGAHFLRVHKSYIVNTAFVELLHIGRKKLQLRLDHQLVETVRQTKSLPELSEIITPDHKIEIPIGEAFFEKVRNSILYNTLS